MQFLVHQYNTYHPFVSLIPKTPKATLPLVRCCAVCGPSAASEDKPLSKCSRCKAVSYCSRDHQKEHFNDHKKVCRHIQKCREKRDTLAERLPPAMFANHVGCFWLQLDTRPYMHAKRDYMLALTVSMSYDGVTLAMEEGLDCQRLCRGDNLGIRDAVPALMLMLGKLQEAYDFIKWWAVSDPDGRYDFADMTLPYLNIHGADMTEKVPEGFHASSTFHVAALAYIKMKLALNYSVAIDVKEGADATAPGVVDSVLSFLHSKPLPDLKKIQKRLEGQVTDTILMVQMMNEFYWKYVQDPHSMSDAISPGTFKPGSDYSPGDKFEVQNWLIPHGLLWSQDPLIKEFISGFAEK